MLLARRADVATTQPRLVACTVDVVVDWVMRGCGYRVAVVLAPAEHLVPPGVPRGAQGGLVALSLGWDPSGLLVYDAWSTLGRLERHQGGIFRYPHRFPRRALLMHTEPRS